MKRLQLALLIVPGLSYLVRTTQPLAPHPTSWCREASFYSRARHGARADWAVCRARRRCEVPALSVNPDDMRRADEPLEEEIRGLQVLGGITGFLVGPHVCGSSVLGIFFGILLGKYLAMAEGRRGAQFRELGWQVSVLYVAQRQRAQELWVAARATAQERGMPEAMCSMRSAIGGFASQLAEEVSALDRASNVSARALDFAGRRCALLQAWATSKGITSTLTALYEGSGLARCAAQLRAALVQFEARVEARLG